jgi:acyl-CoA reductase-like NAD-dependent aldehyde dehydrogenase
VRIREATACRIVPVNLELGGKDPAYVRADADIPYAAAQIVDGAVFNSGQSCCAVERVYVHADVHDAFVAEVQKELMT